MPKLKSRILILDGFRAIAILSVLLYHYFSRWTPPTYRTSLYPYGGKYNYFGYGYLGVYFFFIISGFIIFFTLEKTKSFASFWKMRMIRLLPSMIFASLITYLVLVFFDSNNLFPESHLFKNFITSISFINPDIINHFFNINVGYLNGSYWSLWPEIQFYILISTIYYLNKNHFLTIFLVTSIFLICFNHLFQNITGTNKLNIELPQFFVNWYSNWISNFFNIVHYLPFFTIGVIFYGLSKFKRDKIRPPFFLKLSFAFVTLYTIYSGTDLNVRLLYVLMISVFYIFIYYPGTIRILENHIITDFGESSYFLYLIHENIGILIIYSFGTFIFPGTFLLPVITILSLAWLSILFTKRIDKPLNLWLKKKL